MTTLLLRPTVVAIAVLALVIAAVCSAQNSYIQHNLVSDIPGLADHTDPNLVNPWGIASSSGSPFWVSDNGRDVSTLYNSTGVPQPTNQPLVVAVPPGAPTGVVFNGTANTFNNDVFLFATESGTIDGWRGALGTTAEILANNSGSGAVYKGIAVGTTGGATYIYAADFHNGSITVLPNAGALPLPGTFTDPNLPAGFSPFNIQNIGGALLVTYAVKEQGGNDDVAGPGNGILDRFDLNGNLLQRLISNGAGSPLNSPWGLAIAPPAFGTFSGDLLVGNFGDGRINAFNSTTGAFLGTLNDINGNPLTIEGLWGLRVGNGGNGGDPNTLYFAAGIPGDGEIEDHGLFGSIRVPDPGMTFNLLLIGLSGMIVFRLLGMAARRSSN